MPGLRRHLTFHFILRDAAGRMLDTSRGATPATCVEGAGLIVDGLEAALCAMRPGETRRVVVPPGQGYGEPDPALRQRVPRAALPIAGDLRAGDRFRTGPDRHDPTVVVLAVEGDEVLLDANHPLAGQTLDFEVELLAVRPATAVEAVPLA